MNCMELKATKTETKKKAVVLGEKKKAAVLPVSPAKKKLRLGLTGKENDEKLNERILTTNKCDVTGWDKAYTNKGRVFYVREETADDWCTLSQTKTPERVHRLSHLQNHRLFFLLPGELAASLLSSLVPASIVSDSLVSSRIIRLTSGRRMMT